MCTCASCSYTDSFSGYGLNAAKGGFANWPRGNPAGARRSAADYAAHWRHCTTWYASKGATREFSGSVPTSPLRYSPPAQRDPGADRTYPTHTDTPEGWSGTAAYVEAFIAANNYAKEPSPARAEPGRPAAPAKAPRHLPEPDRNGAEPVKIYMMKARKANPVGRPPIAKGGAVRKLVTLDPDTIAKAKKLGDGKLSAGLREAVRRVKAA